MANRKDELMCYGSGCLYERYGSGECGKPQGKTCPQDFVKCDSCGDYFDEKNIVEVKYIKSNLPAAVCRDCADDEDIFKEVK